MCKIENYIFYYIECGVGSGKTIKTKWLGITFNGVQYKNSESLCWTPDTNIYVNYTSTQNNNKLGNEKKPTWLAYKRLSVNNTYYNKDNASQSS